MINLHELMDELVLLFIKHMPAYSTDKDGLRKLLVKHYVHGTLDWVEKNGKIVAAVRYNINKDTSHIIDLVIDKDQKGLIIMKLLIARGWSRFPYTKYLTFERGLKYTGRENKTYKLKDFFKKRRS